MKPPALDSIDLKILDALQRDASVKLKKLAGNCHISEATCSRRVAALKKHGFIQKQVAVLSRARLGLNLTVFVLVSMEHEQSAVLKRFEDKLKKAPMVVGISFISGQYDYLLQLAARDMEAYSAFAEEYLTDEPCVKKFTSLFEMKSLLSHQVLPLQA